MVQTVMGPPMSHYALLGLTASLSTVHVRREHSARKQAESFLKVSSLGEQNVDLSGDAEGQVDAARNNDRCRTSSQKKRPPLNCCHTSANHRETVGSNFDRMGPYSSRGGRRPPNAQNNLAVRGAGHKVSQYSYSRKLT
jgi:hypothetical protein